MVEYNCVVKIFVLTLCVLSTNGFNLSPKPNLILKEPNMKVFRQKYQSSYFGFTINLRSTSVFVGAPRAQSSHESQRNINETGVIYKCYIARSDGTDGICQPYFFDSEGDVIPENNDNSLTHDSEMKAHQWLGASMDGGSNDSDPLVVCAPRLAGYDNSSETGLMNGICYWTPHTKEDEPFQIKEITALRLQTKQLMEDGLGTPNHIYGEQGLSVHVTKNNEEFIIGAPGVYLWKGSVIRYYLLNSSAEVLNPSLWNQDDDSYFGYSVGSGYFDSKFPEKMYYVASAPRAKSPSGEVYIFDMIVNPNLDDYNIEKKYIFVGSQGGEYFGYAVLAEDFNGDGLTDLIITAPQYSSDRYVEQGAIYVFTNKGDFVFENKTIISPVEGNGRFGTSISKLGDINGDGYNDIAVGAPFAGNGIVFIYLGSSKSLRNNASQQLSPSGPLETSWGSAMFGHGFSKGVDIDNNGFNDFAIGAPNSESVFVYYAYPIVKIHATINSTSEMAIDQKTFQIGICYNFFTNSKHMHSQNISIRFEVDPRVTLQENKSTKLTLNKTALTEIQCHLLNASVSFVMRNISQNIELKMHYDLIDGIPDSENFCAKCATLDPDDPKVIVKKIPFTTGCASNPCSVDLKIKSIGVSPSYLLGSCNTISVTYEVTNFGESAYNPQIKVTSSNKMPFNNIPPYCKKIKDELSCDLNPAQLMFANGKENITITYDVSDIEGSSMNLTASVFCTGTDKNLSDNSVIDVITFQEFTDIEVIWKTNTTNINMEENFDSTEINLIYEVKNRGQSKIQELEIVFDIPIAHKFYGSIEPVPIIEFNITSIQGFYNGQKLSVELETENKTRTIDTQAGNQVINQPSNIDSIEMENDSETAYTRRSRRRRHSTEQVEEAANNEHFRAAQKKSFEVLSNELKSSLASSNRTIVFTCIDPEMTTCERVVMKVKHFTRDTSVDITFKYNVSLTKVNTTLVQPWENFAIITKLNIVKVGDSDGKTINIIRTMETIDVIILKYQLFDVRTPWIVIISSIIGGLLILATISYVMYKSNFFKRKTKEEMKKLVQEKQDIEETEEEMANMLEKQQEAEGIEA